MTHPLYTHNWKWTCKSIYYLISKMINIGAACELSSLPSKSGINMGIIIHLRTSRPDFTWEAALSVFTLWSKLVKTEQYTKVKISWDYIFNCNFLRTKNISKKCTVHKNHILGQRCSTTLLKNVSYTDNQSALIKFIISRFEQQKHEVERRAFEQERESLLASLAQERSQLVADKQWLLQETDQLRR